MSPRYREHDHYGQKADNGPLFDAPAEDLSPPKLELQRGAPTLEQRFRRFDEANPKVWRAIVQRAHVLVGQGRQRIGIAEIVEGLRYERTLETTGDPFKFNNSYRAFYARKLIDNEPELADYIEVRRQNFLPNGNGEAT